MNKFICFALVVFACIATGSCSYGNLAKLAMGSYNNPSSSSSSSSSAAAADAPAYAAPAYSTPTASYNAPSYNAPSYQAPGYTAAAYNAPSYSAPMKSYEPKYSVHPAYATELYHGQQNYKTYNSPPQYSQLALPIVPSAPVAKLYVPNEHSYAAPAYNSRY